MNIKEESISSLTVEDLLGLLNCPQEEIVCEVRSLIKGQFSSVSDKWLVTGLLDYFFSTNSKRVLDLLMGAPEPHCKYLLEKISSGIRNSGDRFRYISLLFYAVSRNPLPIWVHKIPNTIMKDLLDILSPTRETDINVLVSGVMVLVLLLPSLPLEFAKYLPKMFDCFWRLVHWTPNREQDVALKPYLQVAVYSLFHRLYALYPCNLLGYLRINMAGQANKSWFLNTLRPMLERVRLHPLLVSETKDTEVSRSRWVRLEPNDLIYECAKLCLDPLQEICEEMYFSRDVLSKRRSIGADVVLPEPSEYIVLCSSENNFWSPGAVQSPSTINTSVPHTPVYAFQLLSSTQSTGIAESPPEAAVEATPETTPFPSPSPYVVPLSKSESNRITPRLHRVTSVGEMAHDNRSPITPLSPVKKEEFPFKFPMKHGQDILRKSEKSDLLQNKLQEIQRQRVVKQKEWDGPSLSIDCTASKPPGESHKIEPPVVIVPCEQPQQQQQTVVSVPEKPLPKKEKLGADCIVTKRPVSRRRKVAVYANSEDLETKNDSDLFSEDSEIDALSPEIEKLQENAPLSSLAEGETNVTNGPTMEADPGMENGVNRKDSEDSDAGNSGGLGLPNRQSMTEIIKNVKTNRLRFLSQCGPPPNIALLTDLGPKRETFSPPKPNALSLSRSKHKSKSFPNLLNSSLYMLPSSLPKRDFTISSISLSPVKPPVETFDAASQTEEAPIVDPYEQLCEVLMVPVHSRTKEIRESKEKDQPSPYELLNQFIEHGCKYDPPPCQDTSWNLLSESLNDKSKSHLRAMQCLMMLERYKREVHAERNRRLLCKIKRLHLLQEKDLGFHKEKALLKDEMLAMNQSLLKIKERNNALEKKLSEMVEKKTVVNLKERESTASIQRDHLRLMCASLQKDKASLTKELENCKSTVREGQRQLKIHVRHSAENVILRNQVDELNKRILVMGEIQMDMHQQMKNYKESQRQLQGNALAREKDNYYQRIQELKHKNEAEKTSLAAAMYRITELERKLAKQHQDKLSHQKDIEATAAVWQERCEALEKRNKELCSINITLESQMTQLLKYKLEREVEERAAGGNSNSNSNSNSSSRPGARERFTPNRTTEPSMGRATQFTELRSTSFISRMTSNEFRPVGFPKSEEQ